MQMAAKLQAMRKKKHEYLQYQRQLALQRVQVLIFDFQLSMTKPPLSLYIRYFSCHLYLGNKYEKLDGCKHFIIFYFILFK